MPNDDKKHLMTLLEVLFFCAQKEISLCSDDEKDESLNCGNLDNFLLSQYNPCIREGLRSLPENAKMLTPDIQNELLEASKQELLDRIKQEAHAAK